MPASGLHTHVCKHTATQTHIQIYAYTEIYFKALSHLVTCHLAKGQVVLLYFTGEARHTEPQPLAPVS